MKTRALLAHLLCVSAVVCLPSKSAAYEGFPTHRDIAENAIPISRNLMPRLDDLLLTNKNYAMRDLFGTRYQWIFGDFKDLIKLGSINEDTYPTELNVRTHFHDPVTNQGASLPIPTQPHSALYRAIGNDPLFGWDWIDAREYFRLGLTSPTRAERDENLGRTFYSLGRISHLLQDMAVPAHVRNDLHYFVYLPSVYVNKDLYERFWQNSSL